VEQERERELARSVGQAIAKARAEAGLTQDELAEALQIGSTAVSRIERGTVMASLPRLVEIAEIVQQPLEALLRKGSDLDADYAMSISAVLAPLDKSDKDLIVEIVEKLALRFSKTD
jgi:transcriptional regulator with XRE-family HTH domain